MPTTLQAALTDARRYANENERGYCVIKLQGTFHVIDSDNYETDMGKIYAEAFPGLVGTIHRTHWTD